MIDKRMQKSFTLVCFGGTFAYLYHIAYQPLNAGVMATARNEIERMIFAGVTPAAFLIVGLIFGVSLAAMKME
jgi:hypothetical protein